jgi:hypothetical protein
MWVMWNLVLIYFETVLASVKDRCSVCVKRTIGDEDIIGSNMTMSTTSIPKVQPFYMRLIIDAFDELVLHHKMCIL